MLIRVLLLLIALTWAGAVRAAEDGRGEPRPGFLSRVLHSVLHPFGGGHRERNRKVVKARHLELKMEVVPPQLKLSETRRLAITLSLRNRSGKFVHLEFPTTQRIEVLIRDKMGKLVTQWSEDQSFANEPSYITINPGERLEYNVSVATRDMTAGQAYTIEGFFPSFDELKIQKTIVPEK